jgi:hypothetical protein
MYCNAGIFARSEKICELFAGTELLPSFAKICWEAKDKNFALVL